MKLWRGVVQQERRALAVAFAAFFFGLFYWGAARLAWRRPRVLSPGALDAMVPFLPGAIWLYLSEFLLVAVAIWLADPVGRARLLLATATAIAVASLFFVLMPTIVPRESPDLIGITGLAWKFLYAVDTPINALPSLHAALAVPAAAALRRHGGRAQAVGTIWSIAVVFSVLATKQHFVGDLAAGLALGALAQALSAGLVSNR